jgi:D-sedoheptulose 7-phosphate isomerase
MSPVENGNLRGATTRPEGAVEQSQAMRHRIACFPPQGGKLDIESRQRPLIEALERLPECIEALSEAAAVMVDTLRSGGRVLVAGNGGSAAEAQHFAGELVGRFLRERTPYAAIALVADSSIVTALGNDYGYDEVFARQVAAYGRPGDILLALSTSGSSRNLIRAAEAASCCRMRVIALTGQHPNELAARSTIAIQAPATETPTIQELHLVMIHLLAEHVERALADVAIDMESRS